MSVGSTRVAGVTEVRAGVYAFGDLKQVSLGGSGTLDDCALTILATVVSHARPDRYILDGGLETFAGETYEWGTYGRILDRRTLHDELIAVDGEQVVDHWRVISRGRVR